jgi:hypothetical protein
MNSDQHAIVITVEGGVIQSIENIPPGVRIVVRDYDVDGTERAGLVEDENGEQFVESIWE